MAPGQPDDQPPGVSHHPARKGDQGEANCFEALAGPLSAQHQPLHRRAQIEGQHRCGPPCGVGSEQPRREPASGQATLQNAMDLLALPASLPRPPDQLVPSKDSVGHHPKDLVPSPVGQPHRWEGQLQLSLQPHLGCSEQSASGWAELTGVVLGALNCLMAPWWGLISAYNRP